MSATSFAKRYSGTERLGAWQHHVLRHGEGIAEFADVVLEDGVRRLKVL